MDDPSSSARFAGALRRGAALFDRQEFFEAHDAWEDGWRAESGERRRLLQGLIQVAAGFVKLQRGSPRGALLNLDKGARRLSGLPARGWGFDLESFLASVARWHETAAAMDADGRTAFDPALLPKLEMNDLPSLHAGPSDDSTRSD